MPESESFQHYQVLRKPDGRLWELGRGAMGVTYKAFDTNLRIQVALKVINAQHLDSEVSRQRFLREARAAAGLNHPNVASVFHLGEAGGNYFYAMEFIDGETVENFVRERGPLPASVALRITIDVARALRAAERVGLVHRDIKPANLMLVHEDIGDGDGGDLHVKVIDFGLAKATEKDAAAATITVAGFVGTPHFASPEQLEERSLDVRSDIYSLGITLWYMLTGKPPFSGTMARIISLHLSAEPPFEDLAMQPAPVVALLRRMIEKEPAARPQTASELRREIEVALRAVGDTGEGAVPATPLAPHETPTVSETASPSILTPTATSVPKPETAVPATAFPATQIPQPVQTTAPASVPAVPPAPPGPPPTPPTSFAQEVPSPASVAPATFVPPADNSTVRIVLPVVAALLVAALAIGGFVAYHQWIKPLFMDESKLRQPSPSPSTPTPATPTPTPTPTPTSTPATPPPKPKPTPTPTPTPTPAPTPPLTPSPNVDELQMVPIPSVAPRENREARYKEKLLEAQALEANGRAGESIDHYVRLNEDYPEYSQGTVRLNALINGLFTKTPNDPRGGIEPSLRGPLERAARSGSTAAMLYLGDHLVANEPAIAAEWYRKAADLGGPEAMVALGDLYFHGTGVEQDQAEAVKWYELASDKDFAKAKVYLAECYESGIGGLRRDDSKAFELLQKADELEPGNPATAEKLALAYEHGRGTSANARRAFELMKQAADGGIDNALGNLGSYYMRGFGTARDPKTAAALFKQGADRNNALCQFFYAQCLEGGLGGAPKDLNAATELYRTSALQGFGPARKWCADHKINLPASR